MSFCPERYAIVSQQFIPDADNKRPDQPAWEDMKRAIMEEKLSRLGVGRGINNLAASALQRNGSIALPHGRAASVSGTPSSRVHHVYRVATSSSVRSPLILLRYRRRPTPLFCSSS